MGYLLDESGALLLAEDGSYLLDEAGQPPFSAQPQVPLDLQCDLSVAGAWARVPAPFAYQRDGGSPPVSIARGKPDESSQANPAVCAWQWNNRDGRFSPKNPLSPYYGELGRNTPVRWSVPARQAYLRTEEDLTSGASCPDASRLRLSGDLDVRVDLKLTDWVGGGAGVNLVGANWASPPDVSWMLGLSSLGTGQLVLNWSPDGSTPAFARSTVPVPVAGRIQLRATLQVSTGTVTFYTASSGNLSAGPWTQLGEAVVNGATALHAASGGLQLSGAIGSGFYGALYGAQVYSGIGGTAVASPDFSGVAAGAASFADAQGNTWTLSGTAEVSDRDYRFHGEMSALPPKWDVTGRDHWVAAQAGGPLRRLSQGSNNAMSAVKRAILLQQGTAFPRAYWPMEDAAGAASFGSAVTGGTPMAFAGSPAPQLASDSTFTASASLPQFGGAVFRGAVAPYADAGGWAVRFLLKLGSTTVPAGATLLRILTQAGAACAAIEVTAFDNSQMALSGYHANGSTVFAGTEFAWPGANSTGVWCQVSATAVPGGVQYSLATVQPGKSVGFSDNDTVTTGAGYGTVTAVLFNVDAALTDSSAGHCEVQSPAGDLFSLGQPLNAWTGELAAVRYARLCTENGYQARIIGAPAYSAAMGPQGQATIDALLKECEQADLGQQFEPRQVLGLGYRTLASMCNQVPGLELDYSASEPGGVSGEEGDSGLDPTYDDMLSKNDWTVTRGASSGDQGATVQVMLDDGSAMSVSPPPGGIGDYANTATVNVQYDTQLPDAGGWLVNLGSVDDLRWPSVPVNLARPGTAGVFWDALDLDAGDMLQVDSAPGLVVYDPVRQLALGFKESLGGFHWTLEFNAVPELPYETGIYDDLAYGRADTDGAQLAAAASSSATTLSVATTGASGILWTTAAADFPFDVEVAGERMTVANITGSSSPQSFTVTRAVNGVSKSQAAGAAVRLWSSPVYALS